MSKIIKHINEWPFGKTIHIILDNGYGIVRLCFENVFPNTCTIVGLSVHKSKRNKGLGNRLLIEAEKEAKENNVSTIYLYADNTNFTYSWYIRKGYKDNGSRDLKYPNMIELYKTI